MKNSNNNIKTLAPCINTANKATLGLNATLGINATFGAHSTIRLQHKLRSKKNLYVLYYRSRSFSISYFFLMADNSNNADSYSDLVSAADDDLTMQEMIKLGSIEIRLQVIRMPFVVMRLSEI